MKFNLVFKRGVTTVNTVIGVKEVSKDEVTVTDMQDVIRCEQLIEKLTGIRVHVETIEL